MKKFTIILFLIFLSPFSFAQFIVAGQHGVYDNYVELNPAASLYSYYNDPLVTYRLDINGDGINDFYIRAGSGGGLGESQGGCAIFPNNSSQICFGEYDTCFGIYSCQGQFITATADAYSFNQNSIIDANNSWRNGSLGLCYQSFEMNCYQCGGGQFGINEAYIGVRLLIGTDTLYGWIKVSEISDFGFTIEAYACNKYGNLLSSPNIIIFPNPATNTINIHLPANSQNKELIVRDVLGITIFDQIINGTITTIDVSHWSQGLYIYQLSDNTETLKGKIVRISK